MKGHMLFSRHAMAMHDVLGYFLGQGLFFFLVKSGWQPCCWSLGLTFWDWLLHWLKLTNIFSKARSVYLYYIIHI